MRIGRGSLAALAAAALLILLVLDRATLEDRCGETGAAPCPGERLDQGLGTTVSRDSFCPAAGYLCDQLGIGERVLRFPVSKGVVRVRVPLPEHLPAETGRAYRGAAAAGLSAWDGHPLGIEVDTSRVPTRRWDFAVLWTEELRRGDAGRAWRRIREGGGELEYRVLSLSLGTGPPGRRASLDGLTAVAAHEMGHALGLEHSPDPGDAMHPSASTLPSPRDLEALRVLYRLPLGARVTR